MNNFSHMLIFLMIAMLMPVAIWVAALVAIFQHYNTKRPTEQPIVQF